MSSESLLPKTCYICLEECSTTSPCECQVPVHRKCLYEFNTKSKNTKCTICQSEFKTHWVFKCMVLVYTTICSRDDNGFQTNFFIETISNDKKGTLGGVHRAAQEGVDVYAYMFENPFRIFFLDVKKTVDHCYLRHVKLLNQNHSKQLYYHIYSVQMQLHIVRSLID